MNNFKNEEELALKDNEEKNSNKEKAPELEKQTSKENPEPEDNELDKLIEKIPFNIYHVKILLLMAIYCCGEGYTMICTSLIMPILEKSWKLTEFQKGFIGGSIFLGFMIGALCVGIVSDTKGRKVAFMVGCISSIVGSVAAIIANDWIVMSITNIIVGIGIGISIPSCMSLISEVTNHSVRSMIMSWVWILFPVGEIIACYVAKFYHVYDYTKEHWRKLMMFRIVSVNFIFN